MHYFGFFLPENFIARFVVITLFACFIWWFFELCKAIWRLKGYQREMARYYDIAPLEAAIHIRSDVVENEIAETIKARSDAVFDTYLEEKSAGGNSDRTSPIVVHLRALYDAGLNESKMDVAELQKLTYGMIFHINATLKNILAVFIVFGLLGTLFGLAESLQALPASLKSSTTSTLAARDAMQSNVILKQAIDDLFGHLGSAFAPSIWGTFLTVIGVLCYTGYQKTVCIPVKNSLDYLTAIVWVPKLLPTTSQRAIEAMRLSEMQAGKNLVAAKKVADFATSIQHDVSDFGSTLKKANRTLKTLSEYGDQMHEIVTVFGSSVGQVSGYQEGIQKLQHDFLTVASSHQQNVIESREHLAEMRTAVTETFSKQSQQIESLIVLIHGYEESFIKQRDAQSVVIQGLTEQNRGAVQSLEERNKEIIELVGKPIVENLANGLRALEETSASQLALIAKQLNSFDKPLQSTVNMMADTLETVVKRTESLLQAIARETEKQTANNLNQIKGINELSTRMNVLLDQLGKTGGQLHEVTRATHDADLVKTLGQLNDNLRSFSSNLAIKGPETTGRTKRPILKIVGLSIAGILLCAVLGGLGYSQYKMTSVIADLQKSNIQLLVDIQTMVPKQQSVPVTNPAQPVPPIISSKQP